MESSVQGITGQTQLGCGYSDMREAKLILQLLLHGSKKGVL
jgi:hypothetical protein